MKTLGKQVITTTRSGNFQYAIVESITNGLATVRLSDNGIRLTNLRVYGSLPTVGEIVIVDYTTNTPYVRAAQPATIPTDPELSLAETPLELTVPSTYTYPFLSEGLGSGSISGIITTYTAGASIAFGTVAYIGADGYAYPASRNSLGTAVPFGMCAQSQIVTGNSGTFLLDGFANMSGGEYTPGGLIYLEEDGTMTQGLATGSNSCSVVLGVACTTTLIRFHPSLSIVELI